MPYRQRRRALFSLLSMTRTVLVADDNPFIRKALCRIFEGESQYELCEQAENGKQAIELALRCRPDLIILDLSMPVMNGLDAARALKRLMPNIPIILFTLHEQALANSAAGEDFPVDRIVSKTDPSALMNHVRALAPA
jgi:two-component system, chemotaxis family, chemotaxis protein CheY